MPTSSRSTAGSGTDDGARRDGSAADSTGLRSSSSPSAGNPLWGGRFAARPSDLLEAINASIDFDRRFYAEDIAASKAHCAMLAEAGVLPQADADAILAGLDRVRDEIEAGEFPFRRDLEDIHMNVESRLQELIGPAAGRLHTARSRNDQVATDFRLWLRGAVDRLDTALWDLREAFLTQAEAHAGTVMPGFTHLQIAQPITFGHHCMAYVEMFGRDRGRLRDARARLNECPLGAAALAGTSFPIDREATARALGFARPCANSLDAVSDRDFALEFLSAASICAVHLSRFAEELVVWSSAQFAFVKLPDRLTTGSSIMPQKRNPDAAELVRAKSGRVFGALFGLLTTLKGLPLAYSKDMQEDKEPVFEAADTLGLCLAATTEMVAALEVNPARMRSAATEGFSTATDLADWLVRELGLPFRQAHHVTGRLVRTAEERGCGLEDLPLDSMRSVEPRITEAVFDVIGVENSVRSRTSLGGTAPERVREAIRAARAAIEREGRDAGGKLS